MRFCTGWILVLLFAHTSAVVAQTPPPVPLSRSVVQIDAFSQQDIPPAVPFNQHVPAVPAERIAQALDASERERLHPFFQPILAAERLGLHKKEAETFDAIIYTGEASRIRAAGVHLNTATGLFATAQITVPQLALLAGLEAVQYVDAPRTLRPSLNLGVVETGAHLLHRGFVNNTTYRGQGTLVAVYDTGIDWSHEDFISLDDPPQSRIVSIWDQTLAPEEGESSPEGFNYGVHFTRDQINAGIGDTVSGTLRTMDISGHGTHVASIAAGNGQAHNRVYVGMAPEADLIIVKGGDDSFSDARIIDGIQYVENIATALNRPVVLNLSLGSQFGPRDGTTPIELMLDEFGTRPGRIPVVAAGNDGALLIHREGTIPAGGSFTLSVDVPSGYEPTSGRRNDFFDLEVWFTGSPAVDATVTSPEGLTYAVASTETGGWGPDDRDGAILLQNQVYSVNEDRFIRWRVADEEAERPPIPGRWNLTLSSISAENLDAWLSDRSSSLRHASLRNAGTGKTVATPATSRNAITVASYISKEGWSSSDGNQYGTMASPGVISSFSSRGPSRDLRVKPEISAPGELIAAALSIAAAVPAGTGSVRQVPGDRHHVLQGTSMAAPHVAGAAALLLEVNPSFGANEIKSLLIESASMDAATGSVPNIRWGYGKLDVLRAMREATGSPFPLTRSVLTYDGPRQTIFSMTPDEQFALRFTPDVNGSLTGTFLDMAWQEHHPIIGIGPLQIRIHADDGAGRPGAQLGQTVNQAFAQLVPGTFDYLNLLPAGVAVAANTDYHLVFSLPGPEQGAPPDTLRFFADAGTTHTGRSLVFTEALGWRTTTDAFGTAYNMRIRPEITQGAFDPAVSVEEDGLPLPEAFRLSGAYPNPFNPSTTFSLAVGREQHVRIEVYNALGQRVATLYDDRMPTGITRPFSFEAGSLPSGLYFYRVAGEYFDTHGKMTLVK